MATFGNGEIGVEERWALRASLHAKGMRKPVGAPWQDGLILVVAQLCAARRTAAPWGAILGFRRNWFTQHLQVQCSQALEVKGYVSPKTCCSRYAIQVV